MDKRFMSRIYKKRLQPNREETKSIKKLGNYLNGHFSKEGLKMSNTRMEEAQHHQSLGTRKPEPQYHFACTNMLIIKGQAVVSTSKNAEKSKPSCTADGR